MNREYGWVMLTCIGLHCQVAYHGYAVGKARAKFGVKYPDMGNGRRSAHLTDKAWEEFNCVMRVHQNYLESLTQVTTNLLLAGLKHPIQSALLGMGYIVSRMIYANGYVDNGPRGRLVGAYLGFLFRLGLLGLNVYGAAELLEWV